MPISNFVQSSFLSGEWSPFAQGRSDLPTYRSALNVCRNGYPLEEGAWLRRSGTKFSTTTRNGSPGRVMPFAFEQTSPYITVFTDGFIEMLAVATQTSGLSTPLPSDFRLVTTNDNQQVSSISTANPAVVQTAAAHGWMTGDQVQFLFATTVNAGFTPLLRARRFKITVTDSTHFSLSDPITLATVDGSTLGWSAPAANTVVVVRMLALTTPYTAGTWSNVRKIQAEKQAILLHSNFQPQNLNVVSVPTASAFAAFSLSQVNFKDGPYLDPPSDGTVLTPAVVSASKGTLPGALNWSSIAWNGTVFCTVAFGSSVAATSTDGLTWVQRALPVSANWSAIAWNGSVFCAVTNGPFDNNGNGSTIAATSPDGITWTQRTLSSAGGWRSISWDGTNFCVVGKGPSGSPTADVMTSPTGTTWTTHAGALPQQNGIESDWVAVGSNGTGLFCALSDATYAAVGGGGASFQITNSIVASSSDHGVTWTQRTFPITSLASTAIGWNGSIFSAIGAGQFSATSPDAINWTQRTMPSAQSWSAIAANGAGLFVAVSTGTVSASSPDGVTWTARAMPFSATWDGIAWNGAVFCAIASGNTLTAVTSTGSFSVVTLAASSLASINNGAGFQSTDVGRLIRLRSEPLAYVAATTYNAGDSVLFNLVYYTALVGTNTGNQPDISPTKWAISSAAARWTWGAIATVVGPSNITVALSGLDLLYPTTTIYTWRLGVCSSTNNSWPTCGVYYEGRVWFAGAVPNRVDGSMVNGIAPNQLDMTPTAVDGTVANNNAISYIFNSDDVNPIFWMLGTHSGIVCGTEAGEWLISAPTTGPITPTNIQAHRGTTYGAANVEAEHTQLTLSFVQRFNQTLLEYFPDVFSGRFTAPSLSEHAKHLTISGLQEIRYQQELLPIIWGRCGNGSLIGASYERDNLFSSQPAKFVGWHRHDLGSGRVIESIAIGPSTDGTVDTLAMVTNDATTGIRHVELMQSIFNVNAPITSGWFQDDAIVPSGGVITAAGVNSTIAFNGLWHLNGKKVTVSCGGVDLGDFTVASGSVTVPIDSDIAGLFTTSYLQSISSTTAYGAAATLIDGPAGRITVPAVVGFTYTSQGQIVRPDAADQTRSQLGPGLGKQRRLHSFGALLAGTQGIFFGTDFSHLHLAQFKSPGGTKPLTLLQLFNGVYSSTVDDSWGTDSMLCWQVVRPYPAALVAVDGFLSTTDR
jgi:hypothetical protein